MIYFVTAAGADLVKIGHTSRPLELRLAEFQRYSPFKIILLAAVDGNRADEKRFHSFFFQHHVRDEWFALDIWTFAQIEAIAAGTFDATQLPPIGTAAWALARKSAQQASAA